MTATDQATSHPASAAPPAAREPVLVDRAVGALSAAAVGDALGGATEGFSPEQIRGRWGGWVEGIVDPYHGDGWRTERPMSPFHKGDGHITDDTLMTHLLSAVYVEQGRHLDAWDIAEHLVDKMLHQPVWVPEMDQQVVPVLRVFLAEKYLALRLHFGNVDPREAGVGNMVNCGAAMYMAPVGIVNAGDPDGAYREAVELAGAHQSSYGREAAGVLAAAVATAAGAGASVDDVLGAVLRLAKDGTRAALEAVLTVAADCPDWRTAVATGALRDAVRPFDTLGETYRSPGLGARRPSRIHAIEELPIALAMLLIAQGNVRATILGGVNYGRDADSIASMGGAIAGALSGAAAVPADLLTAVSAASRIDLIGPARALGETAVRIREADLRAHRTIDHQIARLLQST